MVCAGRPAGRVPRRAPCPRRDDCPGRRARGLRRSGLDSAAAPRRSSARAPTPCPVRRPPPRPPHEQWPAPPEADQRRLRLGPDDRSIELAGRVRVSTGASGRRRAHAGIRASGQRRAHVGTGASGRRRVHAGIRASGQRRVHVGTGASGQRRAHVGTGASGQRRAHVGTGASGRRRVHAGIRGERRASRPRGHRGRWTPIRSAVPEIVSLPSRTPALPGRTSGHRIDLRGGHRPRTASRAGRRGAPGQLRPRACRRPP